MPTGSASNENRQQAGPLARTAFGQEFDPTSLNWDWRGPLLETHLDFKWISQNFPGLLSGAQHVLAWVAENRAEYTLNNNFAVLDHFLRNSGHGAEPVHEVAVVHLLNYRASGKAENGRLSSLSSHLRVWQKLEQPGIDPDVFNLLDSWRLKGNEKGRAVATMDPRTGPLTDLERESLLAALHDGFASGTIRLANYCLALLAIILAARSYQLAALKLKDLKFDVLGSELGNFRLMVPRAKQRQSLPRSQFTERPLTSDLGLLLKRLSDQIASEVSSTCRDPQDAPLFPTSTSEHKPPTGFELHHSATEISQRLRNLIESLNAKSERTGERISAGATRFRRTLGTNAAREGHGERVIAALLDHSDTQNAGVYVETTAEFIGRLDRAMAFKLAPLAQAFSGTLVSSEADARFGDRPENRITGPHLLADDEGLGTCGQHDFCALAAPLACYTCRLFQPWLEGPHEKILSWLLRDRERLLAFGDPVIARTRDRIILAVAEVVSACEQTIA